MNHYLYNNAIINKLSELVQKYPEQRFGQLLINSGILEMKWNTLLDGERFDLVCNDPFYEEPEITWNRMCKNKFCFNNENV